MLAREMPQMKIRVPPALKDWLTNNAARNRRSINAEIVLRLEMLQAKENAQPAATGQAFVQQ
ncbi:MULTISPECIES: Arc family DNA-binding protein [unclassified Paraburkholderia]|uniref:Arc family DNA-binding protein n=1 Tax=unclassified Paraburkholderia TaxID=2615204 RepID=UPI00160D1ECA|nr:MULTISPECIES: Arc family DNA-binding protein [unclassified Paraburkholderia]MBB5444666.1 hypothetical protein [Paraburkholderia sp. WSM4177]MBB5485491.1 hypothetical protein [Paraburkholderia sp. WSM4180]